MLTRGEVISDLLAVTSWSPAFRCCLIISKSLPEARQSPEDTVYSRTEAGGAFVSVCARVCARARACMIRGCSHSAGTELKSLPTP